MPARIDENALLKALQERMLADIARRQESQSVINNLYGSGQPQSGGMGGIGAAMQSGAPISSSDDDADYLVDILREDLPINPETGKPGGWKKSVHRHKQKKDGEPHPKKKVRSGGY